MLKNYLKITFAVMCRRKFYTFISLFGISLTLTVLLVITAFFDNLFAPNYPEINRDRTLYASGIDQRDTVKNNRSMNNMSYYFIDRYMASLKTPEKVSAVGNSTINTYFNAQKGEIRIKYTDANFWEIMGFDFLEGKAFNAETIKSRDNALIISSDMRDKYFGKGASVVGKTAEIGSDIYHIVGVVRSCSFVQGHFAVGDVYMPYTSDKSLGESRSYTGRYSALILAKNVSELTTIQAEFAAILPKIPLQKDGDFTPHIMHVHPETAINSFIYDMLGDGEKSGKPLFITLITCFALLFMSLPALNLVNVNISRIMERASEIGIRKAFGASSGTLTVQFIVENIILTIIGGLLALLFSAFIIAYINRKGIGSVPYLDLQINWKVAIVAFILSLIFGLLSGVYPAWRMAKLSVVSALKA
jgi:putative ABC transport system permease protein